MIRLNLLDHIQFSLASRQPTLAPASPAQSGDLRLSGEQRRVVLLLVVLSLMSYFQRTAMSIAGPGIAREFSLSETQMGAIYSAFILGYALLMIPGGWLADRIGPRRVLTLFALGSAAFTSFTAFAGKPGLGAILEVVPAFLLIRVMLGTVTAPLYPSAARMNADWMAPGMRARAWGWVAGGAGIGGALAPVLFSHLIASVGWRMGFILTGAGTALIAIIWMLSIRDYPAGHDRVTRAASRGSAPLRLLFTNRSLLLTTAAYFTVAYFEYIFFYWAYYYLGQIRQMGTEQSAWYTTALFLSWMIFAPIGGRISDACVSRFGLKAGLRAVPMAGIALSTLLVILAINVPNAVVAALLLVLALGFAAATDAGYWAATINLGGSDSGAAGGILNTGGNLGGFLAPVVTPWIASRFRWSAGLYFGCGVALLSLVAWVYINPEHRPEPEGSESTQ